VRFSLSAPPPAGTRLLIRDISGRLVSSFIVHRSSFIVPMAVPAGVYFASLEPGGSTPLRIVLAR
jgi:hypothetical protein